MENEETLKMDDNPTNMILEAINGLKTDVNQQIVEFRTEMNRQIIELRTEMNRQIIELRADMNQKIGDLRREMNERLEKIEVEVIEIKELQFSCDVRIDRVQSMAHDGLNIGHGLKADIKIMTAELRAWFKDVLNLQERVI